MAETGRRPLAGASTFAACWGAAMTAALYLDLGRINGRIDGHLPILCALFFAGGLIGGVAAHTVMRRIRRPSALIPRTAVALPLLALATAATTAGLFVMQDFVVSIRPADLESAREALGLVFDLLYAAGTFVVLGLRLFLPWGLPALCAGGFVLAAGSR